MNEYECCERRWDTLTDTLGHTPNCPTQQWQPGHRNTQTAVHQRLTEQERAANELKGWEEEANRPPSPKSLPSAPERFGEYVVDPMNDPERRFYRDSLPQRPLTREELEKQAATQRANLENLLRKQTTPFIKLPAKESDAWPEGNAAQAEAAMIGIGGGPTRATTLPDDGAARKQYPVATGVLDYFPDAIAAIAYLSYRANAQHNPGEPVHWARGKSMDHFDTMMRHFLQRGTIDKDGIRHSVKVAWRALAALQEELEAAQKENAA